MHFLVVSVECSVIVDDVVRYVGMSSLYFVYCFCAIVRMSLMCYLKQLCLWHVRSLFLVGLCVSEVVSCCGFESILYFIRDFKVYYGDVFVIYVWCLWII